MIFVAVLAGGIGSRMGDTDTPKQFLNLGDRPILIHTIEKFVIMDEIDEVIVLTPQNFINHTKHLIEEYTPNNDKIVVIEGGKTRNDTLKNSIDYIYENYSVDDDSIIITHDSVRPFVTHRIIQDNIKAAKKCGACDTVIPATDTIVESRDGKIIKNIPIRDYFYQGQTPQTFKINKLNSLINDLTDDEKEILTDAAKIFVLKGKDVEISHMNKEDAKKAGAMALFGEKYGDIVRVVTVPGFSMELCGGSHVKNIGQIGMYKIIGESGVAAGVRRIEAITGKAAIDYMNAKAKLLQTAITTLKTNESNLCDKIANLLQENKEMKAEIAKVQAERAKADSNKLLMALKEYNGVNVIVGKIQAANMDELRNNADLLCNKFDKAGVVVLGAILNDKVNFVVKVNKDGVARGLHAGKIVKEVAMVTGGNGGGRPDMAQAGGKQPEKLNDAFAKAHEVIQSQIK